MENEINHIRNLVYFGNSDNDFDEKEKEFIRDVGKRLGLDKATVENEINNKNNAVPPLPANEVLRYILLDDILNLSIVDNIIKDEETLECKRIAKSFGFDEVVIDAIISKMNQHLDSGFSENNSSGLLKNELFKLTSENKSYGKYY